MVTARSIWTVATTVDGQDAVGQHTDSQDPEGCRAVFLPVCPRHHPFRGLPAPAPPYPHTSATCPQGLRTGT